MKSILKLLTGVAATLSMAGAAQAQDLFKGLSLEQNMRMEQMLTPDEHPGFSGVALDGQFRSRTVALDRSAAEAMFNEDSPAFSMDLDLFPGRTVKLHMTDFDPYVGDGGKAWSGRVEGYEDGSATLVMVRNGIIGQIQYGGETYRITRKKGRIHVISELDLSLLPKEAEPLTAPSSGRAAPTMMYDDPVIEAAHIDNVRVMFMITRKAHLESVAASSNLRDEALLAISMANTALINTALGHRRFRFAGFTGNGCGYDEDAGSYSTFLLDATDDTTCVGAKLAADRTATSADLVALLRVGAGSTSCGVGWYALGAVPASHGISLTSRTCISGHTVTHEMGHNMGLKHDRYVESGGLPAEYNYGLARPDLPSPIRTIMSYSDECSDLAVSCPRVPLFTNRHALGTWMGEYIGVWAGATNGTAAVNRKSLTENWAAVSAFK